MRAVHVACLASLALACSAPDDSRVEPASGGTGGSAGSSAAGTGGSSSGGQLTQPSGGNAGGGSGGAAGGGSGGQNSGGASAGSASVPQQCAEAPATETAPPEDWTNATGNLANMASGCAALGWIQNKPCSKDIVAGVNLHGMWQTTDSGTTWSALGTGPGSVAVQNRTTSIVFDPEDPSHFWETGIHVESGVFRTQDGGSTFQQLGAGMVTGSQLVSVDFGDPERKTVLVGTHGGKQQLYLSTNGGDTFTNVGLNLPSDVSYSESPLIIDDHTFLVGIQDCGGGTCGIHRSTDSGVSWEPTSDFGVNHFSGPLWASDGAIYWPLAGSSGIAKSTDLGETWTKVLDMSKGVTPAELPDGSIMTMGTTHILRSTNGGDSWEPVGAPLPSGWNGLEGSLSYSAQSKTIFISRWDCGNAVLPDAIMKAGFDWEQ